MLWMSFERHINAFRVNVLGLEPLRVGEGGWNQLNIMKVGAWQLSSRRNSIQVTLECCLTILKRD